MAFIDAPTHVDWKTTGGTFRVYKTCLGPLELKPGWIGRDATVGPGYVATVWDARGRVVVDDSAVGSWLGPNSGATGLGQLGFHLARVPQPMDPTHPFTAGNASDERVFQISGRFCNANRHPNEWGGYNGWGVRASSVVTAPHLDANGIGRMVIDVTLGDAWSELVRVRYTYAVGGHDVKAWLRITTLCDEAKGDAFVKEPKVIVGVNPAAPDDAGYQRMTVFDEHGFLAPSSTDNRWASATCGSSEDAHDTRREWGGQAPTSKTGQCDADARTRVRFWNGIDCKSDAACLVVAAGSADAEGATFVPWAGAAKGLDAWATRNVAENRDRAAPTDSPGSNRQTSCNDSSASHRNRRWELAGFTKTPACHHTAAIAAFHSWEGGNGIFDCENLYYRMGKSEEYVVALAFGFNSVKLP
jgi:hypothetical protein